MGFDIVDGGLSIKDSSGNVAGITSAGRLKIDLLTTISGNHSVLTNLDYASSGHTGFASSADLITVSGGVSSNASDISALQAEDLTFLKTDGSRNSTGQQIFEDNVVIRGNLTVSGTEFITETETVLIEDNLMMINYGETTSGVAANNAGIEVDRGLATNYRFMFDEANDHFEVGISGSEQAVATREDAPTANYVPYWNNTAYRFDTAGSMAYTDIASNASVTAVDNKIDTTSGTLQTQIDSISGVALGSVLTVSGTYQGITMTVSVSEAVSYGDVLAQDTDFSFKKGTAVSGSSYYPVYAMALSTASGSMDVLMQGQLCNTDWNWSAGLLWVSNTAGDMTQTVLSGAGEGVQPVGFALSADTVYFTGYAGHGVL